MYSLSFSKMKFALLARLMFAACASALCALPQTWISVGVKGGVPLTDAFADRTFTYTTVYRQPFGLPSTVLTQSSRTFSGSRLFILGPTLEAQLPLGFALEAEALCRPMDLRINQMTFSRADIGLSSFTARIDSWEFPLLAKYRFPLPGLKPYLDAGPSFRAASGSLAHHLSGQGVSAGIGVEARIGPLRIAPEVRYTHWDGDGVYTTSYHAVSYPNQIEFLAGVSTAPSPSGSAARALTGWSRYLSLGVKGGLPFTNAFLSNQYVAVTCGNFSNTACPGANLSTQGPRASRNYLIGPMVEIHLPHNVSVEGNALYAPLSLVTVGSGLADFLLGSAFSTQTFASWQFPVVAKYKFRAPFARPYLEAGPTFRTASTPLSNALSKAGVTAGLGVEASIWRLHLAPEVRFVHWGNDHPGTPLSNASRRNQGQFLIGLSYE